MKLQIHDRPVSKPTTRQQGEDALKVQADSTHNILIRRKALVDGICVIDNVTAEDEASDDGVYDVSRAAERQEVGNETGHAEGDEGAEKERAHAGEIILM